MSDENQGAKLRVIEPSADRQADIEELLEEAMTASRESKARGVVVTLLGEDDRVIGMCAGNPISMLGALRITEMYIMMDGTEE
jgi:hypothetical protein